MTEQERKERKDAFTRAATPMVEYLRRYGDPHTTVIVTQTDAEMVCGEIAIPYPYPDADPSPEFYSPKPSKLVEERASHGR